MKSTLTVKTNGGNVSVNVNYIEGGILLKQGSEAEFFHLSQTLETMNRKLTTLFFMGELMTVKTHKEKLDPNRNEIIKLLMEKQENAS